MWKCGNPLRQICNLLVHFRQRITNPLERVYEIIFLPTQNLFLHFQIPEAT